MWPVGHSWTNAGLECSFLSLKSSDTVPGGQCDAVPAVPQGFVQFSSGMCTGSMSLCLHSWGGPGGDCARRTVLFVLGCRASSALSVKGEGVKETKVKGGVRALRVHVVSLEQTEKRHPSACSPGPTPGTNEAKRLPSIPCVQRRVLCVGPSS